MEKLGKKKWAALNAIPGALAGGIGGIAFKKV